MNVYIVVSVVTVYGLDGVGFEFDGKWISFSSKPSTPPLGPTQPSIQGLLGFFPGGGMATA
jgi:hypothetical protein